MGVFTGEGVLMGMLVAELQSLADLEGEMGPLLHKPAPHSNVMYILSLGKLATCILLQSNLDYPDLIYPAPRLSGLSQAQAMCLCACV